MRNLKNYISRQPAKDNFNCNMPYLQTIFLGTVLVTAFCGCTTSKEPDQDNLTSLTQTRQDWGFIQFSKVKAYRMNWTDEDASNGLVGEKNKLNRSRIPKNGINLNLDQISLLREAVTGSHPDHPAAGCFNPHHAFVFYDDQENIVGHIDICFRCSNYRKEPVGFAQIFNLGKLASLFRNLNIPVSNPKWN